MGSVSVKTVDMTCRCVVMASLSCEWFWIRDHIEVIGLCEAGPFLVVVVGCCRDAIIYSTFE